MRADAYRQVVVRSDAVRWPYARLWCVAEEKLALDSGTAAEAFSQMLSESG